ncbi:MAG: hypothetical protein MJ060_04655, partial [Clostridia bacterium]|nr:hypothetical protein [Clostridia bacterium]
MAEDSKGSIFREKTLKAANEVSQSEDYIKVTSPRLWIVLIGMIMLLAGFLAWGFLGRIETTVRPQTIYVQGGTTFFLVQKQYDGMHIPENAKCTVSDFASNKVFEGNI